MTAMENETEQLEVKKPMLKEGSYLRDEILKVKPIESGGKWSTLLAKGQDEKLKKEPFMYNKVKKSFQVPLRPIHQGGGVKPILDNQKRLLIPKYKLTFPNGMTQQEFFEQELGVNLNPTLKQNENFWRSQTDKEGNTERRSRVTITKEGLTLNLNTTGDMLKYLILLSNTERICPNYEDRFEKATYEFVIVSESKVISKRVEEAELKAKAYIKYSEITQTENKMRGFIKSIGRTLPSNYDIEWLKGEILNVFENNTHKFLEIVEDPLYNAKIFVQEAIDAQAIIKMNNNRYTLDTGVELGDLNDTISYLSDPENQDAKNRIKSKIELTKRK